MSDLRQALLGILAALICAFIILGSLALALAEGHQQVAKAPASTQTSPPINTPLPGQPTFTPSPTPLPTSTLMPVATSTCPQPPGWVRYDIQLGDTFADLAQTHKISIAELRRNNCNIGEAALNSGTYIFVPPLPSTETPTPTTTSTTPPPATSKPPKPPPTKVTALCGRPYGWVIYIIRRGDTLSSIARATGTSVLQLKFANCLTSDIIHTGNLLYVPRLPAVNTPVPTRTRVPTATRTMRPPTFTPTPQPPDKLPPTHTPVPPPPPTEVPPPTNPPPPATPIPPNTPVPYPI